MWTCAKCGETVQGDFVVCWACGTSIDGVEDPDFFADVPDSSSPGQKIVPPDPNENMVTIASCNLPAEAQSLRLKLEEAGVPVFLADELTVTMDWLLANAIGGIKVQVPQSQVPLACRILDIDLPATEDPDQDEEAETEDEYDEEDEEWDDYEEDWENDEDEEDWRDDKYKA